MKLNKKSIIAVILSVLLIFSIAAFVFAENVPSDPNTVLSKSVENPPVQDGIINGHKLDGKTVLEYGTENPVYHLSKENGAFWAEDMKGNPLDCTLPSYIDLYLSRDDDALYAGIIIQEENHSGNYGLTTFLGFGDAGDSDTKNSGALTTFVMNNANSAKYDDGTWLDTQVTAVSGREVSANGTITDTTSSRRYNKALSYALPYWGSVSEDAAGDPITIFEVELDFKDALLASGKSTSSVPAYGYFSFDLNLYSGNTQIGVLHCAQTNLKDADSEPDGSIKTVPFMVDLTNEPNPDDANANLSALTFSKGSLTEKFSTEKTEYTLNLLNGITSVEVNPVPVSADATYTVTGNSDLSSGEENVITVRVSAKNGVVKVYKIKVEFVYNYTDVYVNATSGSDSTGNGTKDAPFKTIAKAIDAKKSTTFTKDDAIRVLLTGTATDSNSLLFGEETIFNKDGDRLPIIIEGGSLTLSQTKVACGNSYIFKNLTLNTAANSTFFAGSGEVEFIGVTFGNTTTSFYGDDFVSSGAFDSWNTVSEGTLTSVTFGKGTSYSGTVAAVGGETTGTSSKIVAKAIVDGGTVATLKGRNASDISIKESAIEVKNGAVVTSLIGIDGKDHTGDLSITIGKDAKDTSTVKGLIAAKGDYTLSGVSKLTVLGGVLGEANGSTALHTTAGGAGALGTVNTITGGTFNGGFIGVYTTGNMTSVGSVTNNVTGGNFLLSFVGGSAGCNRSAVIPKVTNNIGGKANISIQGGILTDENGNAKTTTFAFVGGSIGNTVVKILDIENNISGSANVFSGFGGTRDFNDNAADANSKFNVENISNHFTGGTSSFFYAGSRKGSAVKTITNTFSNTTIGTFYAGSNAAAVNSGSTKNVAITNTIGDGANITTFMGGTAAGTVTGKIINTVNGGEITTFYGATNGGAVNGSVENTVNGGDITTYYGGTIAGTLTGTIENEIKGGKIKTFYGGSSTGKIVSGSVTNTVSGGTINIFYGGSEKADIGTSSNNVSIVNTVSDGTISELFYGGNYDGGAIYGTITNNITGGNFHIYYGSTRALSISGETRNNISGGQFGASFVAGTVKAEAVGGAIITNIPENSTAIFNGEFFGGNNSGSSASAVTTIAGGTFNGTVVPGSVTGSTTEEPVLIVDTTSGSPEIFGKVTCSEIVGGSGKLLLGKNAFVSADKVTASLTIYQSEGWVNKHQYFFASDITSGEIKVSFNDNGSSGSYKENTENGYSITGFSMSPIGAKLILDTRVGVKFFFEKDDIDESFTYTVNLGESQLTSGTYSDLTEEGGYFALTFTGIGLSDFDTEFEVVTAGMYDPNFADHNTIIKLAELGARSVTKQSEKALFYAIADLGRVAKDSDGAKYNLTYKQITPKSYGEKGEDGSLLTFTGKNLMMNDALGIRLYGSAEKAEDVKGIKVIVNGYDITKICDISEPVLNGNKYQFTVDIFFSVTKMQSLKSITVYDQNEKVCLKLSDQVDWIAQTIINREPENNLAKQVLIYIQKVYNFINKIDYIIDPNVPGTEVEIGDKVELF